MVELYHKSYLYARVAAAKLYIDAHFLEEEIDIDKIASEACFSKFHFLRLFKQIYQVTPHQYVTSLKIRKAKSLLKGGASITSTYSVLGFYSPSSFNKLFKKHVKIAPSKYAIEANSRYQEITKNPLDYIPACFFEYMHWDK